jgi:S-DNA-T family DNA segregation ATPase FtsK/SpoIIIE
VSKRRPAPKKKSVAVSEAASSAAMQWANEALSVIFYALSVFILISFLSHQMQRGLLPFFDIENFPAFQHPLGPVGKVVGAVLAGAMGWCALVPSVWFALVANYFWNTEDLFSGTGKGPKFLWALGFIGILVFSCTLAAVFWGSTGGGTVGTLLASPLLRYFSVGGASLIASALFLLSYAVATRQSIATIFEGAWVVLRATAFALCIGIPRLIFVSSRAGAHLFVSALGRLMTSKPERERASKEEPEGLPFQLPRLRSKRSALVPEVERTVSKKVSKLKQSEDEELEEEHEQEEEPEDSPQQEPEESLDLTEADEEQGEEDRGASEADDDSRIVVKRRNAEELAKLAQLARRQKKETHEDDAFESPQFPGYVLPDVGLLTAGEPSAGGENDDELREKSRQIEAKLKDFGIYGKVTHVHPGPVITLFEFEPAPGVKVGKIAALQDDLAMSLKASSLRIIAPIPRRGTVGIEVPNKNRDIVRLRDVLESEAFVNAESILSIALGKDTYGDPVVVDISTMPHLLMAGATGTGKSVCINTLIVSMLYRASPAELGLILIDPKILELSTYEDIPHLRVPVVTEPKRAKGVLQWAVNEMNRRYRMMQRFGVRNIDGYNALVKGEAPPLNMAKPVLADDVISLPEETIVEAGIIEAAEKAPEPEAPVESIAPEKLEALPKIVIVIDELADLMLTVGRDIEELITRLAQKARAAGIHLILATQRPSVDVITGLIKANFPARLSFRVTARVDSRTILDQMGADKLLGRGDMLFVQPGAESLRRIHGAFISDAEVKRVVDAVKQTAKPQYDERIMDLCNKAMQEGEEGETKDLLGDDAEYDAIYDKAVELVLQKGQASTSMLQRAFRIGYNRAARVIDMMEKEGLVGPMDGAKPREVIARHPDSAE